jgi:hypothetical protein
MYAAKLYDQTTGAVTVQTLLERAKLEAASFKNGTPEQVSAAVEDAESRIARLQDILKSVQKRRHEAIAHLDKRTVIDPVGLATRAKLTISDLEKVFAETNTILNKLSALWNGVFGDLTLIGDDDYKSVMELISDAKHAQVDRWEKDFPNTPCDFPRPKTPRRSW